MGVVFKTILFVFGDALFIIILMSPLSSTHLLGNGSGHWHKTMTMNADVKYSVE